MINKTIDGVTYYKVRAETSCSGCDARCSMYGGPIPSSKTCSLLYQYSICHDDTIWLADTTGLATQTEQRLTGAKVKNDGA